MVFINETFILKNPDKNMAFYNCCCLEKEQQKSEGKKNKKQNLFETSAGSQRAKF